MNAIVRACAVLALGMHAWVAGATIYSADLLAPGDGLLTVDSASGWEWLDLTVTRDTNDMNVPRFNWLAQGFWYANLQQVTDLLDHAVAADAPVPFLDLMGAEPVSPLMSIVIGEHQGTLTGSLKGVLAAAEGPFPIWTIVEERPIAGGEAASNLAVQNTAPWVNFYLVPETLSQWAQPGTAGIFLIRKTSAIPELGTWPMLALGLAGVIALHARRRHSPCQA